MREQNIIPEIKMSEAMEGKSFEYYLEKVKPFQFIAVNTSSLFNGNIDMLKKAKEAYQSKSILRKDFITIPRQIDESYEAGASHVLLLAEYLESNQLEKLVDYCSNDFSGLILPVLEVNSYRKLPKNTEIVLVNSRNLNTGKIKMEKAIEACKKYREKGFSVVYASGENSDAMVNREIADYVLIGTAFMKESLK